MKAARSRTGTTGGRLGRTRSRVLGTRKPTFVLSLLSEALDSRVTLARASSGVRYNNCGIPETIAANLPRFDYDPPTAYNLYPNSQWTGGGVNVAPTAWIAPSSGTRQPNGTVGDATVYRFTAASQRPFIQWQSALVLAVGDVRINSVYIGAIYSGSVLISNVVNWVAAGGGGNQQWFADGVEVTDSYVVQPNTRVSVRITVTTAGAIQPRTGPGAGGACTVDMDCSRPGLHAAYLPLPWYGTTPIGPLGNGVIRGLLVEEQRTNLIDTSETSAWASNTPNDARPGSFFGKWNGTVLVKGSVTGDDPNKSAASGTLPAAGTTLAGSVLLDLATATGPSTAATLLVFDADGIHYIRVLIIVATGASSASATGANLTLNRWAVKKLYGSVVQVEMVGTFAKVQTNRPRIYVSPGPDTGQRIVAGCAQIEVGAFATSYIPTTTAQATRAADDVAILYSNLSGFRNDIGTFYFEGIHAPVLLPSRIALNVGDTLAERRAISAGTTYTASANSGGNFASSVGSAPTAGAIGKVAFSYAGASVSLVADGTAPVAATLLAPAASDRVRVGSFGGAAAWNAPIRAIRYWPRAIVGAELRTLAT